MDHSTYENAIVRIVTVVGARPQFVKASPVSAALKTAGVAEILIHTGQHYDREMSELFFTELELKPPDFNLGVGSGSHALQTAEMMRALEPVIEKEAPDWVLIYGDTNSTLAGALVASKLQIPVAHVEAGLRSFNRAMPEEINRRVADAISDLLFAPTETAVNNLLAEGVAETRIKLVGDVMLDAAMAHGRRAASRSRIMERLGLIEGDYILVTVHRAENTDCAERLSSIARAIGEIAEDYTVVFPVHPRTHKALEAQGLRDLLGRCRLIDPVGYLDMVRLESCAALIATDSGGVQKEAFFHKRPCVTLRDETEWVELVQLGWNRLCDVRDSHSVVAAIRDAIGSRGRDATPYGMGTAAKLIAVALQESLPTTH